MKNFSIFAENETIDNFDNDIITNIKPLSEQNLTNDFLFKEVMKDPEIAKIVLECILGTEIEKVDVLNTEVQMQEKYGSRGIRLDVFIKSVKKKIYNVEMQAADRKDLPRRMRYYQGQLDTSLLPPGLDSYNHLNNTLIIFICDFDPFGMGKYVYIFENFCEDCSLTLGDGAVKMVVSTKGTDPVSKELEDFLTYAADTRGEVAESLNSEFIKKINNRVEYVKSVKEINSMYMLYESNLARAEETGLEKGKLINTIEFYKSGDITTARAAKKLGITEDEFLTKVREYDAEC